MGNCMLDFHAYFECKVCVLYTGGIWHCHMAMVNHRCYISLTFPHSPFDKNVSVRNPLHTDTHTKLMRQHKNLSSFILIKHTNSFYFFFSLWFGLSIVQFTFETRIQHFTKVKIMSYFVFVSLVVTCKPLHTHTHTCKHTNRYYIFILLLALMPFSEISNKTGDLCAGMQFEPDPQVMYLYLFLIAIVRWCRIPNSTVIRR